MEDAKFYFLNGFLNFNFLFPLALAVWPLQFITYKLVPTKHYSGKILYLDELKLATIVFCYFPRRYSSLLAVPVNVPVALGVHSAAAQGRAIPIPDLPSHHPGSHRVH